MKSSKYILAITFSTLCQTHLALFRPESDSFVLFFCFVPGFSCFGFVFEWVGWHLIPEEISTLVVTDQCFLMCI